MDIVGKLFGSPIRVKLMRLFLFNSSELAFNLETITKQSRVLPAAARAELKLLEQVGLVKTNNQTGKKKEWRFNPKFSLARQLKYLLDTDFKEQRQDIGQRFSQCGQTKLLIIAGALIGDDDGRVDLVLVGDNLRHGLVEKAVKTIEAEVGRELVYALMDTKDFIYRLGASDKFIRDLLDYPHEKLINKLNL